MGCCISKCTPEKHSLEQHQFNHTNVQDKLVISPITTALSNNSSNKISPSPPSPTSSSSSISSFTCTRSSNTISSSSSLSTASSTTSSALSFKDRSFSNEFLWSCYKDNPHITHINSLKDASLPFKPTKAQCRKTSPLVTKPNLGPMKLSPQETVTMPHKRVRSNSPTNLTRQKSFRRELPERGGSRFGSPSPSRRFNGDKCGISIMENKRVINSPKVNLVNSSSVSSCTRNEGFTAKGLNPNNSSRQLRDYYSGLRHRKTCAVRIGSKFDETVVKDVMMAEHDLDSVMEDIDNPLISLDCFIFL